MTKQASSSFQVPTSHLPWAFRPKRTMTSVPCHNTVHTVGARRRRRRVAVLAGPEEATMECPPNGGDTREEEKEKKKPRDRVTFTLFPLSPSFQLSYLFAREKRRQHNQLRLISTGPEFYPTTSFPSTVLRKPMQLSSHVSQPWLFFPFPFSVFAARRVPFPRSRHQLIWTMSHTPRESVIVPGGQNLIHEKKMDAS